MSKNIKEIYKSEELDEIPTTRNFRVVQKEGNSSKLNQGLARVPGGGERLVNNISER